MALTPTVLFGPVGPELLIVLLIIVFLFGANKIPKLARSSGEAMGQFKKGREEIEAELQEATEPVTDAKQEVEQDTQEFQQEVSDDVAEVEKEVEDTV
jgi:sec-independent protein translocase protein TatA